MILLRAHIFNLVFYANLIVFMFGSLPLLVAPRKWLVSMLKVWANASMWWHRVIVGTKVEFRNIGRIPDGPLLVASKHQSLWETFALFTIFDDPAIVLKRELMWIPLLGWFCRKLNMIPVDRAEGARSLRHMIARAKEETAKGRQVIIFPEGTRTAPGAAPQYRGGIVLMYQLLGLPCLPVALNSGWFWPRRKSIRYPGTIIVDILNPIPAGLAKSDFLARIEHDIESSGNKIARETANQPNGPPVPATWRGIPVSSSN
ncbi:MAG: 1-acyl-sn-glycerol-3-phosphate acyltransferase [Fimbriimonadaceae bacterium]|nr:1-acyl-sn-glycerol-3-phosphate acyltransferase [Alphaproteobacteria bacterium]